MSKSVYESIDELIAKISESGCRVTIPYAEPSPLTVIFDGSFSGAAFIPSYPSTLHVSGMDGHIAVTCINSIKQIRGDKYVVNFGDESHTCDMLVKILE